MSYNAVAEDFFLSLGIPLTGFADLSAIDGQARRGFRYGISLVLPLYQETLERIAQGSIMEAFTAVNGRNKEIKEIAAQGEEFIRSLGYRAFSQANIKRDDNYETPLPHKTIATLAGIGYIGKASLLVTRIYGPAVRLSSILTDMPFDTGNSVTKSECGKCRICVDACPAGALRDHVWSVKSLRSEIIDVALCSKEIKQREGVYNVTGGAVCGICVAACPKAKGV